MEYSIVTEMKQYLSGIKKKVKYDDRVYAFIAAVFTGLNLGALHQVSNHRKHPSKVFYELLLDESAGRVTERIDTGEFLLSFHKVGRWYTSRQHVVGDSLSVGGRLIAPHYSAGLRLGVEFITANFPQYKWKDGDDVTATQNKYMSNLARIILEIQEQIVAEFPDECEVIHAGEDFGDSLVFDRLTEDLLRVGTGQYTEYSSSGKLMREID
jgi:hypothetical protein